MVSEKHVLNKKTSVSCKFSSIKKKPKGQPRAPVIYFFYTGETNSMPNSSRRLSELRKFVRLLALKQTTPMFIRTLANSSGQVVVITSKLLFGNVTAVVFLKI